MTELHEKFQEAFDEFNSLEIRNKIEFLEELLFYFTLTSRAIWSDIKLTDTEKVDGLKSLNELSHRIWNIKFELQQGNENNSTTRLYDNMKSYSEQSESLRAHLVPSLVGAFANFKRKT
jgi:hypothetical protein